VFSYDVTINIISNNEYLGSSTVVLGLVGSMYVARIMVSRLAWALSLVLPWTSDTAFRACLETFYRIGAGFLSYLGPGTKRLPRSSRRHRPVSLYYNKKIWLPICRFTQWVTRFVPALRQATRALFHYSRRHWCMQGCATATPGPEAVLCKYQYQVMPLQPFKPLALLSTNFQIQITRSQILRTWHPDILVPKALIPGWAGVY
jgi:hypothetical protein